MADPTDYEGIVILGSPRSGTTLLRRLLNAHPRLACPPETNVLNACGRFLREEPFSHGLTVGVVPGLAYSGIDPDDLLGRLRDLAFGLFADIRAESGKARWVEKSPFDVFYVDEIERLCGARCRYVWIVRHPLDVVVSTRDLCDQMGTFPLDLHDYVKRHGAPFDAFAHAWVDANSRLARFHAEHPDWCVRVRYEDVVGASVGELERVLGFLGEPTDVPEMIAKALGSTDLVGLGDWKTYELPELSSRSIGRWQKLDAPTVTRLAAIVEPLMVELGYDPLDAAPPPNPAEARRLHQIRQMATNMTAGVAQRRPEPAAQQERRDGAPER